MYIPDECAVEKLILIGLLKSLVGLLLLFYSLMHEFPKDYVVRTRERCVADNSTGIFVFN